MELEQIQSTVTGVAARLFAVPEGGLTSQTDLHADLRADSMALIEFVIDLEEAFDEQMDTLVAHEVRTLGDIASVIHTRMNGGSA